MNYKKDKKLFDQAANSGCKTAAEFALYLKAHEAMTGVTR